MVPRHTARPRQASLFRKIALVLRHKPGMLGKGMQCVQL